MMPTWSQNGPPKSHLGAFGPKSCQTVAQNVDLEAFSKLLWRDEIAYCTQSSGRKGESALESEEINCRRELFDLLPVLNKDQILIPNINANNNNLSQPVIDVRLNKMKGTDFESYSKKYDDQYLLDGYLILCFLAITTVIINLDLDKEIKE